MDNGSLNYELILDSCGFGSQAYSVVLDNLRRLEDCYDNIQLTNIYNYILQNIHDIDILTPVVKLSDSYRSELTLNLLMQLLVMKDDKNEPDAVINLKVLCAKAISNYKDNTTVCTLLDCMNNKEENYKVRLACADALGRIGDKYAVQPLINLVEDENEKSVYLKETATFALGMLGDTSAIDPLISILTSKQGFLGKFTFLKEKIVEALGKMNSDNKKVMFALKQALMDSSPMVRINAIEAIMNSDSEESIQLIRTCLNDENDEVQQNALIALYNIEGRDILDEVLSLPSYSEFLKTEAQSLIDEYEMSDKNE